MPMGVVEDERLVVGVGVGAFDADLGRLDASAVAGRDIHGALVVGDRERMAALVADAVVADALLVDQGLLLVSGHCRRGFRYATAHAAMILRIAAVLGQSRTGKQNRGSGDAYDFWVPTRSDTLPLCLEAAAP